MLKNLKTQLLLSGVGALALLLLGVFFATRGYVIWASVMMVLVCIYIIALNLWFCRCVADPIDELTSVARRIAEGSYGVKIESKTENEIGRLAKEINNMSEKVAVAEREISTTQQLPCRYRNTRSQDSRLRSLKFSLSSK